MGHIFSLYNNFRKVKIKLFTLTPLFLTHKEEDTMSEVVVVDSWCVTATTSPRLEDHLSHCLYPFFTCQLHLVSWFWDSEAKPSSLTYFGFLFLHPSRRSFPWGRFAGGLRQITGYSNFTALPTTSLTRISFRNPLRMRLPKPLFHNPAPQFPMLHPRWKILAWAPVPLQLLRCSLAPMQPLSPLVLRRPSVLSPFL